MSFLSELLDSNKELKGISVLADIPTYEEAVLSTGLLPLDIAWGGGVQRGRIYTMYAPKSAGKTTLAFTIAASWQKEFPKGIVCVIESERALDPIRCKIMGLDPERVAVNHTLCLEDAFDYMKDFGKTVFDKYGMDAPVLFIWDSWSTCTAKTIIESENIWAGGMQLDARQTTQGLKKLNAQLADTQHAAIIIQHVQDGGTDRNGNQLYTTSNIQALKHYPSAIVELSRSGSQDDQIYRDPVTKKDKIGTVVRVKLVKNKLTGMDDRTVELVMYMATGFNREESTIRYLETGNCNKYFQVGGGGNYTLLNHKEEEYKKVRGKDALKELLKTDKYFLTLIEYAGYKHYADSEPLFAEKYAQKLKNLEDRLNNLLLDSVK